MVVVAVIAVFATCVLIDWLLHRGLRPAADGRRQQVQPAELRLGPPVDAGGFQLQPDMAYHPGHTWVYVEGPGQVRVGLDDLAARLTSPARSIALPAVGDEVVQGLPAWVVETDGRRVPLLSPVTGEVVAVNQALAAGLLAPGADPYGKGWLCLVRPHDLRASMNNLLSGGLVRHWVEEAGLRLRDHLGRGVAAGLLDGGEPIRDLARQIPPEQYASLVRELLLTQVETSPQTGA
ncbi:MAG: glycine cleavage system protein H [Gemmatimonadota bacterium]